jgi:hypothetical protein
MAGDGAQQNMAGDGAQQNMAGDGAQQNMAGDGAQQNMAGDGADKNILNFDSLINEQTDQTGQRDNVKNIQISTPKPNNISMIDNENISQDVSNDLSNEFNLEAGIDSMEEVML